MIDEFRSRGRVYIGKNQTILIKEPNNSQNLVSITFDNKRIPYKIFPFSQVSKANGSDKKMFNFGFCSQSKFEEEKAKEILGDIEKSQLKIDYDFLKRVEDNIS